MGEIHDDLRPQVGAATEFWYCPICYPQLPEDPAPKDVIETRYTSRDALTKHLLDGHPKPRLVQAVISEVDPR